MMCVLGISRFPVYVDSTGSKILGSRPPRAPRDFVEYVRSLPKKDLAIAIWSLRQLNVRRRFLIRKRAFNPELRVEELLIRHLFVYPDMEPEKLPTNCLALGIRLTTRRPTFFPLASLHALSTEEINALLQIRKIERLTVDKILTVIENELNIVVEERIYHANGTIALAMRDDQLNVRYAVLVDGEARVLDTTVCFTADDQPYLHEFIMLTRDQGYLNVYPRESYQWAV